MNDRFKFRVWDKQHKRYKERYVIGSDGLAYLLDDVGDDWYDLIPNEEVIVEQCTGLRDKNGKLIYEGDVVRFSYFDYNGKDYHMVGVIEYAMFGLMIKGVKGEHFEKFTGYEEGAGKAYLQCWLGEFDFDPDCDFEIIGNIHDKEGK